MRVSIAVLLLSSMLVHAAHAQTPSSAEGRASNDSSCVNDTSWTAPQKPFRIYGNTWYVGPRGLGVFLITAPTGDVLIDGGVPADASLIEGNIQALGFDPHDVKWILNSHAHCDHAGGIAQLARDLGATVIANVADTALLARGGHDDPQYDDRLLFPPVHASRTVTDGQSLRLGELVLTAHSTPGHTRGNTTWTWTSCEGTRCLRIVDVASLSAPGYNLVHSPRYPDIVKDFEYSFSMVAALPCDIALSQHPGVVHFWDRMAKRENGDANALFDRTLCRSYATDARSSFEAQLAKQRADSVATR
jgi:metallo-beta-lactamase class B